MLQGGQDHAIVDEGWEPRGEAVCGAQAPPQDPRFGCEVAAGHIRGEEGRREWG